MPSTVVTLDCVVSIRVLGAIVRNVISAALLFPGFV